MKCSGRWVASETPPTLSSAIALVATLGVLFITAVSVYPLGASITGIVLTAVSLVRGSTRLFSLGVGALFGAVLLAGLLGTAPVFLLAASFLLVVAWSVGRNGFSIAAELGRGVSTFRIEIIRAVSCIVVFAAGSSVGYAVFLGMTGRQPVLALFALLVGVVALLVALQGWTRS